MRLRVSVALSNGLLDLADWFTDRGHEDIGDRVMRGGDGRGRSGPPA